MGRNRVRAVVLCEDTAQRSFLVHLFKQLGVEPIRIESSPGGVGSAEHWVRKQLPRQVLAHRSQAPHQANLVLVAMTDGDRFGVEARKRSLDEELTRNGHTARGADERIAYLVPTWSMETWLAWLCRVAPELGGLSEGASCKDVPAYRRLADTGAITPRKAAEAWAPVLANEGAVVPSLTDAREELRRIP